MGAPVNVRSPALLDLLARLLREHPTRGATTPMDVVPVVLLGDELDDLDEGSAPLLDLMHAVARYADGGDFADANRIATAPGGHANNPALLGALQATLELSRPGAEPLRLAGNDGPLAFAGLSAEILSPGQLEVLGLAMALLDMRWDDRQLGIITYSERSMDPLAKRACWRAVTVALATPELRVGSLRTLVVAVRAPAVVYDTHCHTELGARYVLEGNRLTPRSFPGHVRQFASEVARNTDQPLVFFLGAGFSRSSSLPLGNTLRDQALLRRYAAPPETPQRNLAVRLFREAQTARRLTPQQEQEGEEVFAASLTLEQVVALETVLLDAPSQTLAEFNEEHEMATPGPAVDALVELISRGVRMVLVTVNFDELIERASSDQVRPFVTTAEFEAFPPYLDEYLAGNESRVPLLKLHGTISDRPSCVINAAITEEGLPQSKRSALRALAASLGRDETPRPVWIYVGASLRDTDIVPALAEKSFGANFEEAWVMPLRGKSVEAFATQREPIWQKDRRQGIDARTMSATADAFFEYLHDAVAAIS